MALVRRFERTQKTVNRVHEGVECGYLMFEAAGSTYLQLDTYGSRHRETPGKISESIQLDAGGASELLRLIHSAFPGID